MRAGRRARPRGRRGGERAGARDSGGEGRGSAAGATKAIWAAGAWQRAPGTPRSGAEARSPDALRAGARPEAELGDYAEASRVERRACEHLKELVREPQL